ncbi:PEP-CTERM sorting domain-containing protein [bacterium]|nr:MAG: PEP-CTERM sorting domain-containing protein [bacterium]
MKKLALLATVSAGTALLSALAPAATLFDAGGFEGYTTGSLIGQNTFQFATGTTGAVGNYTVVNQVSSTGVSNNYIAASGTGTSYAFPDLASGAASFTPAAGELISVSADIARNVGTTGALSTASYAMDVFSTTARITRFGLTRNATTNAIGVFVTAPFNTTTGQFQAGQPLFNVTVSAALTANTFYNLESRLNYTTQSMDLYNNGTLFVGNIPFATAATGGAGTQTDFSDADFSIVTGTGNDTGFFDNYKVSTIAAVPEPATMAALGLGTAALLRRRRKSA